MFLSQAIRAQSSYSLGNTAWDNAWFKLGRLSLDQQGRDALIRISGGGGYNADRNQNGETVIHFRTSNASNNDNGFYASGSFYNTGKTKMLSAVRVVQINGATWDFYALLPSFTGEGTTVFVESAQGSWTKDLTYSGSAPGGTYKDLPEEIFFSSTVSIGGTGSADVLFVGGNIKAKKLIVTQSGWSDYVFDKDYKLRDLGSLDLYIKQNKHLPDIPSAKEVEEKGTSVGDNQALLLKKIEELTLYIIGMNKKIEAQDRKIGSLQKKLHRTKSSVNN